MLETLFLVPTQLELKHVSNTFLEVVSKQQGRIEICGFGTILSGIRTIQLIHELKPKRTVLFGIAGSLTSNLSVGEAVEFSSVACYGIGAGCGSQFVSSDEMGWQQWEGENKPGDFVSIGNVISLTGQANPVGGNGQSELQLLTGCSASADLQDVEFRLSKFPNASAEDMEGFSVAAACHLANVPLKIIRGISNHAGDRNVTGWKIGAAMSAVEKAVLEILQV